LESAIRELIERMADEVNAGPPVYRPSEFWVRLSDLHEAQLKHAGFESFKRTVNQSYYNWLLGLRDPQVMSLARWLARHPRSRVLTARLGDWTGFESQSRVNMFKDVRRRWLYQFVVAALWEFARDRDRLGLLDRLQEPALGAPLVVRYRGRDISQDLANSALEFYSIAEAMGRDDPGPKGVLELGAGYGRLAWLYLSAFPRVRYLIVDIPPALALAQEYLTRLCPDRPTFRFRHFDSYEQIEDELGLASLAFLTPNQLELLPPLGVAAFVNISSLHEMRPDQINVYAQLVDRHTDGIFYTKQWREWTNPNDGLTLAQSDYPVLPGWDVLYERPHAVHSRLFEAAYGVNHIVKAGDRVGPEAEAEQPRN
jgi:putative sugar O-methyltransferase